MAVDGHQRSVPIRMRPRAIRAGTDQDQGVTRTSLGRTAGSAVRTRDLLALRFPADGLRVPGSAGVRVRHRSGVLPAGRGDYGYGDPGYADPSYEGPKTPYGGPAFDGPRSAAGTASADAPAPRRRATGYRPPEAGLPGYHVPEIRDSARPGHAGPGYQPQGFVPPSGGQEIWPVTGAQEALPELAPSHRTARRASGRGAWRPGQAGSPAYPDQWYDNPRLDDRVLDDVRYDQPRPGGSRLDGPPAGSRPADPRLEGMNYGELRYDDPTRAPVAPGEPATTSRLTMSRGTRNCGAAPRRTPRASARSTPAAPQRRMEPQAPDYGQQPGFPQAPDRAAGYGEPRGDWGGSLPQAPQGPQLSAGRMTGPGRPARPAEWQPAGFAVPAGSGRAGTGFLSAPAPRSDCSPRRPAPGWTPCVTARPRLIPRPVPALGGLRGRPGPDRPERQPSGNRRGAAGPWPRRPGDHILLASPAADRRPRVVRGLLAGRRGRGVLGPVRRQASRVRPRGRAAGSSQPAGTAKRRTGRRRGGSNDHRLWLGLGGVVIVAAAAITGIIKFEFPSHSGPRAHHGHPGQDRDLRAHRGPGAARSACPSCATTSSR